MLPNISRLARATLDWFFPRLCIVCEEALLAEELVLCSYCAMDLAPCTCQIHRATERLWASPIFRHLYSLYSYQRGGVCQSLIHSYKYRNNRAIANLVAQRARVIPGFDIEQYDLVCAVPLAPNRWEERGYNQSLLLAQALVEGYDSVECSDEYILRLPQQYSQKHLRSLERRQLVEGVFYPNPKKNTDLSSKRILVVDDVLTTGATLLSLFSVLEALGLREVDVFTIAIAVKG